MRRETLSLKTPTDIRKIYDDIFYEEIKENDPKDLPDGVIFRRDSVSVCSASGKGNSQRALSGEKDHFGYGKGIAVFAHRFL